MKKTSTKIHFEIFDLDNSEAIRIKKRDPSPSLKSNLQQILSEEEWQSFCNEIDGILRNIISTENARGETMNDRLSVAWIGLVLGAVLIPVVFWKKTVGGWIVFVLIELLLLAGLLWRFESMKCLNMKRTYEQLNTICSQMTLKINEQRKDIDHGESEDDDDTATKNVVEFEYVVVQEPILKYRKKSGLPFFRFTPSLEEIAKDNYIEITI